MNHRRKLVTVALAAALLLLGISNAAWAAGLSELGKGLKPKVWGTATAPQSPPSGNAHECCKGNHQDAPGHGYHQDDLNKEVVHYYWTELRIRISRPRRLLWKLVIPNEVWVADIEYTPVGGVFYAGDPETSQPTLAQAEAVKPHEDAYAVVVTYLPGANPPHTVKGDDDRVKVEYLMELNCQSCPSGGGPCSGDYCTTDWGYVRSHSGDVEEEMVEYKCKNGRALFRIEDEEAKSSSPSTTADIDFSTFVLVEEDKDLYPRCGGRSWAWPQKFMIRYYRDTAIPGTGGGGITVQKGPISVDLDNGWSKNSAQYPPKNQSPVEVKRGEDKLCPSPTSPLSYCGG